jgi:cytochrome d ubiquinol oxidase subunit I
MIEGLIWHRIQFAFTITFHYLFPQLTMGLVVLIAAWKFLALWKGNERYNEVARFWGRIFAVNFAMGVVTGIPLEFQFGANWARFSRFAGRSGRPDPGERPDRFTRKAWPSRNAFGAESPCCGS